MPIKYGSKVVNDVFYGNKRVLQIYQGSKLVYNAKIGLPSGYTQLEYLQSDSKAYIDTGIAGDIETLEIGCKFSWSKSVSYGAVYGNYISDKHNGTRLILEASNVTDTIIANTNTICTTTGNTNVSCNINEIHNVVNTYDNVNVDDTIITKTNKTKGESNSSNIALFNRSLTNPNTERDIGLRVYSFYVKNGSKIIRNFIPVKRNIDNVLGMYDKVTKQFFTNAGTGTFTSNAS